MRPCENVLRTYVSERERERVLCFLEGGRSAAGSRAPGFDARACVRTDGFVRVGEDVLFPGSFGPCTQAGVFLAQVNIAGET